MNGSKSQLPPHAKCVFKGKIFDVYQWEQKLYDGTTATFEALKRPNTAVILATVGDKILIEEQEQPHRSHPFLALPGGRCDDDEDPLLAAKRELLEETGYVSDDWELWMTHRPFIKIVWTVYIYIARNCYKKAEQHLDTGEKIKLKLIDFEDFLLLSEDETFYERELVPFLYRLRLYPEEKEKFGIILLIWLKTSDLVDEKRPKNLDLSAFFDEYIFSRMHISQVARQYMRTMTQKRRIDLEKSRFSLLAINQIYGNIPKV